MLRMSNGEGQSSCRRCMERGIEYRDWDSMMYTVDYHEGVYCWNCAKEIGRNEQKADWTTFMIIWLYDFAKRGELYYKYVEDVIADITKNKIKINPIDFAQNLGVFNMIYSKSKNHTAKIFYYIALIADTYTHIYKKGKKKSENSN